MGFMDKFKDAASQAQLAAKSAGDGGEEFELEVEVKPTGGEPYSTTFSQQIVAQSVDAYKQKIGEEVVVNVDPDDPQSMLLWG